MKIKKKKMENIKVQNILNKLYFLVVNFELCFRTHVCLNNIVYKKILNFSS